MRQKSLPNYAMIPRRANLSPYRCKLKATCSAGGFFTSTRNENGDVAMEFKDTGCGIPEKYKDRIFEAFFTNKMDWKGTGLGLSICYDIIKNHSGSILVDSQLGKGGSIYDNFTCKEC